MTQPLAQRLRDETRPHHTRAERAGLMPALLRGQLPRPAYAALLGELRALYGALEPALAEHAGHPWLAGWPLADLRRHDTLAADLAWLATAPEPAAHPTPGRAVVGMPAADPPLACRPATQALRERIASLRAGAPGLLLAHAYVRYLGDLSGGQIVARQVRLAYGLQADEGTRFYDFGPPEAAAALLARCRQALADARPGPAEADALVAEACWSFARHAELFEQLAPVGGPGSGPAHAAGPQAAPGGG